MICRSLEFARGAFSSRVAEKPAGRGTMARKICNGKLESRSARLKLEIRPKPYTGPHWRAASRCSTGGTKATVPFADADDYDDSDGKTMLTFFGK